MLAILAPARNTRPAAFEGATRPLFMPKTMQLVEQLRACSPWQLEGLLDVPPERALRLFAAYRDFDPAAPGTPALLAYYGAAYRNMAPQLFTPHEMAFAQACLRIFSALYGILRPLDGVLEHRLGLKKAFSPGGHDLYAFWGDRLHKELYKTGEVVVNLASVEYARLVTPHLRPGDRLVNCRFLIQRPHRTAGTVATVRAARGLMARYIVENSITRAEDLRGFDADGYRFAPAAGSGAEYVFIKRRGFAAHEMP